MARNAGQVRIKTDQEERDKRRELVPRTDLLGNLMISMPARDKVWLIEEAYRRQIPVSWVATEVIKLGIEAYDIINGKEGDNGSSG